MRRRRGFPVVFYLVLAHALLTQSAIFVVRPTMSYRAIEVGLGSVMVGVLAASFTALPLLLALPIGRIVDRFGVGALILGASLGMTLSLIAILLWGHSLQSLLAASAMLGVSQLGAAIGQQSLVGESIPRLRYAGGYAYYTLTGALGQMVAPVLIGVFGRGRAIPNTSGIFVVVLVFCFLATAVSLSLFRWRSDRTTVGPPRGGGFRELAHVPGLPGAVTISAIAIASIDVFTVYLPVIGAERGHDAGFVSVLLMVRAMSSVVSRVMLGPLERRLGPAILLIWSLVTAGIALLICSLSENYLLLIFVMVPIGFGLGLAQPITMAWVALVAPVRLRGRAISLRLFGNRLAQTVVPVAAGGAAFLRGGTGVLSVLALLVLAGAGLALRTRIAPEEGKRD